MTTRAWLLVAVSALIIGAVGVLTALQSNAPPTGIFDPQCGVWCPEGTRCQRVRDVADGGRAVYDCR